MACGSKHQISAAIDLRSALNFTCWMNELEVIASYTHGAYRLFATHWIRWFWYIELQWWKLHESWVKRVYVVRCVSSTHSSILANFLRTLKTNEIAYLDGNQREWIFGCNFVRDYSGIAQESNFSERCRASVANCDVINSAQGPIKRTQTPVNAFISWLPGDKTEHDRWTSERAHCTCWPAKLLTAKWIQMEHKCGDKLCVFPLLCETSSLLVFFCPLRHSRSQIFDLKRIYLSRWQRRITWVTRM